MESGQVDRAADGWPRWGGGPIWHKEQVARVFGWAALYIVPTPTTKDRARQNRVFRSCSSMTLLWVCSFLETR